METGRIKKIIKYFWFGYIAFVVLLFLAVAFSIYDYMSMGTIERYCDMVSHNHPHTFVTDEGKACRLNWKEFLPENVYVPLALFVFLVTPALVALFFLKKK